MEALDKLKKETIDVKGTADIKLATFLETRIKDSKAFTEDFLRDGKTFEGMKKYIFGRAQEALGSKSGYVEDEKVYEWAEDYYHATDEDTNKFSSVKATYADAYDVQRTVKKAEKPKAKAVEKKTAEKHKDKNDIDGQMSIFDILGGANAEA